MSPSLGPGSCSADPSGTAPLVSLVVINYNGLPYLEQCLKGVLAQSYPNVQLIVIDNASTDGSADMIADDFPNILLVRNRANFGFCRAFNQGVALSDGDFVLPLNPDVVMTRDFVTHLVVAAGQEERIGAVSGKLLRDEDGTIDSTGIVLTRSRRPRDRGQGEKDRGQYDKSTAIFAACGAAPLYTRHMLEDIAVGGQYMDESFFAFYDDVDLGWRARLLGWRSVYAPQAVAYHPRSGIDRLTHKPGNRLQLQIQIHALKNRYLMIVKNDSLVDFLRDLPFIVLGDVLRIAYIALFRPQLLAAWWLFWSLLPHALEQRREIAAKKRTAQLQLLARS